MNSALADRYKDISSRVAVALKKASRTDSVVFIAVSKVQSIEAIQTLYDMGQRDFGENYAQELLEKAEHFLVAGIRDIRWHFIGHLQTNKVKQILPFIASIHSVDSLKLAQEISKRWVPLSQGRDLPIFLSVNIDAEDSKDGIAVPEVPVVVSEVAKLPGLSLEGLMCIPAPGSTHAFQRLGELEMSCRPLTHGKLSMGMSDDFTDASPKEQPTSGSGRRCLADANVGPTFWLRVAS
jgi:pyridoxal phosphate enzyme (YggS family)